MVFSFERVHRENVGRDDTNASLKHQVELYSHIKLQQACGQQARKSHHVDIPRQ